MTPTSPKPPVVRPLLAHWLWRRGYEWREAGELFGVTHETVRSWCLPFDDPDFRRPRLGNLLVITERTGGEIGLSAWDREHCAAVLQTEAAA